MKSIFRPGPGQRIEQFTAAYVMEAVYPGSWVCINTEVPTAQGNSGVLGGGTLGVLDYVECELIAEDVLGAEACFLGCVRGTGINSVSDWTDVSGDVLANYDLAIIQSWGVHPGGWIIDVGALGDFIGVHATEAGEGDPSSTMSADGYDMGTQLRLGTSVTMGDAQHNAIVWVRQM
jgi:hypothetical protein